MGEKRSGRLERRRQAVVVLGAGGAVAAIAVGFAVLQQTTPVRSAGADGGDTARVGAVDEWRTEHWRDTLVEIPADWGYGGAPMRWGGPEEKSVACGAVALVTATGERLAEEDPAMPYVGRPVPQTDMCAVYPWEGPNTGPPEAPYVWLGAAVEPGTVELGDGYVQETVVVNGSTVTVAARDAGLREQILSSASGGETCFSELEVSATFPGPMDAAHASEAGMTVCVYRRAREFAELAYAVRLGEAETAAYLSAIDSAPPPRQCSSENGEESEWAVLEITRDGLDPVRHVVHFGFDCAGVAVDADGLTAPMDVGLTPGLVQPWAANGVPAVMFGPTGGKGAMLDSFIGPQG